MLEFTPVTREQNYNLIKKLEEDLKKTGQILKKMKESYQYYRLREIVEENYELGKVKRIFQIFGGTVNQNYAVGIEKNGKETLWFLRQYVADKEEQEILYEHALLEHIRKNGFRLNAIPQRNLSGVTYFKNIFAGQEHYFAISEFLSGEDTYQWERNEVTPQACCSAAETIADFHRSAFDFLAPEGWGNKEPVIRKQLTYYANDLHKDADIIARNPDNLLFTQYLSSKLDYLDAVINDLQCIFEGTEFPTTVIHSDLHPGNFKYDNERVVAIFDFDWPKKDVRLYETAISAMFFSSSWKSENNGEIDTDLMELFISSYNNWMINRECEPGPMSNAELNYFPEMMMVGSMYVVHFCIEKCAKIDNINIFEYFYYTMHQLRCVEWIGENREKLRKICIGCGEEQCK